MLKHKVIVLILLCAVFVSAKAYCQQNTNDPQIFTVSGRVIGEDVEGGVIVIRNEMGKMMFYLSVESDLYRFTRHISIIEINKGDPVIIQYVNSSGKKNIVTLVDRKSSGN